MSNVLMTRRAQTCLAGLALVWLAGCGQQTVEPDQSEPAETSIDRVAEVGEISGADPEDRGEEQHDEHDDAHDDEMAGGEAHVHGHGELAVVLEGNQLTISVDAPLESLGLPEQEPENEAESAAMQQQRLILGDPFKVARPAAEAKCVFSGSDVSFRYRGDHGSAQLEYRFNCASPEQLDALELTLFESFASLEEIEAVFLSGADQSAAELTPENAILRRN